MRHSGQWKRIFWLVQTIFYIFFQRLLPEKAFFLSSGNLVLKESFIPANGERYFFLIKTITLLESFFYQRKPSLLFQFWKEWKSIFKDITYSCWWKMIFWLLETIFFHCLLYFSRSPSSQSAETHFSVQKNSIFYSELSYLLVKTII